MSGGSPWYTYSTAVYCDMDIPKINCTLFHILPAFNLIDDFPIYILRQIFGGCIGPVAVS